MLALVALVTSVRLAGLLPYPVKAVHFELRAGETVTCHCLHLAGSAVARTLLRPEEKERLDALLAPLGDRWERADQRQRATMVVDYLRMATVDRSTHYAETVLSCSDGLHARAMRVVTPLGETVSLVRDLTTGEYLMHLHASKGSPAEFVKVVLEELGRAKGEGQSPTQGTPNAELRRRVEALKQRFARDLATKFNSWDVNGQVYLPLPDESTAEVFGELGALLAKLSPEGGRRIQTVWGILQAFDNGEVSCEADGGEPRGAGPALDPDYLVALRPSKLSCQPDRGFWMRRPSFELPDRTLVHELTDSKDWQPLPPDLSLAEVVRWLRRR